MNTKYIRFKDKAETIAYYPPYSENSEGIIYFDNPATSFPKPKSVIDAIVDYQVNIGSNPGRSGHELAAASGQVVYKTRKLLADLFGVRNPMHVVFCSNATDALNLAIKGFLKKGDRVITSSMEHNSTIRPLKELEKNGIISLNIMQACKSGIVSVVDLEKEITPETTAIVINHISNVNGCIQPLQMIGELCNRKGLTFIVDCAQSAGIVPVNMSKNGIHLLAFTGHKGLYGPTGTGGLIIADSFDYNRIKPLKQGGTGSFSDKIIQPEFLPDCFESGTLNVAGLSGLFQGIKIVMELGFETIRNHKKDLQEYFIQRAKNEINRFRSFTSDSDEIGLVSFIIDGISVSEIAGRLSDEFNIMCRAGLHCAPLAHKTLSTFPEGTVRFGFGIFNTRQEIDIAVDALKKICNN